MTFPFIQSVTLSMALDGSWSPGRSSKYAMSRFFAGAWGGIRSRAILGLSGGFSCTKNTKVMNEEHFPSTPLTGDVSLIFTDDVSPNFSTNICCCSRQRPLRSACRSSHGRPGRRCQDVHHRQTKPWWPPGITHFRKRRFDENGFAFYFASLEVIGSCLFVDVILLWFLQKLAFGGLVYLSWAVLKAWLFCADITGWQFMMRSCNS